MTWLVLALAWVWLISCLLRLRMPPVPQELGRARLLRALRAVLLAAYLLLMAVFTALTVFFQLRSGGVGVFLLTGCLCALGVGFAALPCLRWNAEGLSVRNGLGWTRKLSWEQVCGWYWDGGNLWLKTARGRVLLPPIMENRESLLDAARMHVPSPDETPLPLIPDMFRGHVRHPARLLAVLAISVTVGAGMACQGAYLLATANASPDNTQQETVTFDSFRQQRQEHFRLYAETADYYVPNVADAALLMQRCGTGERFTLFTRPYMEGRAVCRAVGEDGTVYLDFADFNADQAAEAAFELAAGLLVLAGAALTAWGCRWPERCPAWLRNRFAGLMTA